MKQLIISIKDVNLVKPIIDFAVSLGLSVDNSNYDRIENEVISIGTSKKYTVAGNSSAEYYKRKYPNLEACFLSKENVGNVIDCLLSYYTPSIVGTTGTSITVVSNPTEDTTSNIPDNVISALYAKVKRQKKSPANYYIKLKDGNYIATATNVDTLGNLQELFNSL